MNLLFFVMATLFLMAAITLGRFDSFLKMEWQSIEWKNKIFEAERSLFNNSMIRCEKVKSPPSQAPQKDDNPKQSAPSSGRPKGFGKLSQKWLLNADFRKKNDANLQKAIDLVKTIVQDLYHDQPFYKKMAAENPEFLQEIMDEIFRLSQAYSEENPKKTVSLDNLLKMRWQDPRLRQTFARILQESPLYRSSPSSKKETLSEGAETDLEEAREKIPYSRKGYVSLKDYLIKSDVSTLRLWLADSVVLYALFHDQALVDSIEKSRAALFREIMRGPLSEEGREAVSKRFQEEFPPSKSAYGELIDYTVTKTQPN